MLSAMRVKSPFSQSALFGFIAALHFCLMADTMRRNVFYNLRAGLAIVGRHGMSLVGH
jgi:hypothetical protein